MADLDNELTTELTPEALGSGGVKNQSLAAMEGSEPIAKKIDQLLKLAKKTGASKDVIDLVISIQRHFLIWVHSRFKVAQTKNYKEALNIVASSWRLDNKNLTSEEIHLLSKRFGIPNVDIALLTGISSAAVGQRIARYEENRPGGEITEDMSDDEMIAFLKRRLFEACTRDSLDREAINAIKTLIELHKQQIEKDIVTKWKMLAFLDEWFFSHLIPSIHQSLVMAGANIDIRAICLELFEKASTEMRELASRVKLPSPEQPEPKKRGRKPKNAKKSN
jgi:predicted transcriptional regulator